MTMAENIDANDMERQFGLDAVRRAFDNRREPWPETPPYDGEGEPERRQITANPFVYRPTLDIPQRKWLYGKHYIRKFLSLDIAAGGLGKSSLKVVEALAMVTKRPLLGKPIVDGPHCVWLYNLEDPDEETERRIHAALDWYQIEPHEIASGLFVNSGRDQPVCIAEETAGGARIVRPVADAIVDELRSRCIDVLILDPFVSSHAVSENDNRAIDMVAKEWSRIADVCNCSINLVHHVRKSNGSEVTAESSRGAVSLIGAARSVVVYNRMTEDEAKRANVPPDKRGFYFRTQNDKANLAPPEAADWHRMNSVDLANGDSVGVACPWRWPDSFEGVTAWHMRQVQNRITERRWRKDTRSPDWIGNLIAEVCSLDPQTHKGRLREILKQWLANDVLREVEGEDEKRRPRVFVEIGTWMEQPR